MAEVSRKSNFTIGEKGKLKNERKFETQNKVAFNPDILTNQNNSTENIQMMDFKKANFKIGYNPKRYITTTNNHNWSTQYKFQCID